MAAAHMTRVGKALAVCAAVVALLVVTVAPASAAAPGWSWTATEANSGGAVDVVVTSATATYRVGWWCSDYPTFFNSPTTTYPATVPAEGEALRGTCSSTGTPSVTRLVIYTGAHVAGWDAAPAGIVLDWPTDGTTAPPPVEVYVWELVSTGTAVERVDHKVTEATTKYRYGWTCTSAPSTFKSPNVLYPIVEAGSTAKLLTATCSADADTVARMVVYTGAHVTGTLPESIVLDWPAADGSDAVAVDDKGCGILGVSCLVDWFLNIDDWVVGLFTPSAETTAGWETMRTTAASRFPFGIISQPIAWLEATAAHSSGCSEPGGCSVGLSFTWQPIGPNQTERKITLLEAGSDADQFLLDLRPMAGAMIYGGMIIGFAFWAFRRYAPGGGGGE